jgi:hypothetical protein
MNGTSSEENHSKPCPVPSHSGGQPGPPKAGAGKKRTSHSPYEISFRGGVPVDIVSRVSAIHANAILAARSDTNSSDSAQH